MPSTLAAIALHVLLAHASPAPAQDEPPKAPEAEPERGLRLNEEGAFQGYTLFGPLQSRKIHLIDMQGEVFHTWETDSAPGGGIYLLENGHLLRCGRKEQNPRFRGGGIGGIVQELDWDGKVLWSYELATAEQTQHHDIEPLPNGNVLLIAWEHRPADEVRAAGRDPEQVAEGGLWPDAILEIRPTRPSGGEVVWEWHVWDHLIQDRDPKLANHGSIPDRPELVDINADHRDQPPMTEAERKRREEVDRQMRALGYVGDDEEEEDDGPARPPRRRPGRESDWLHTNAVAYNAQYDLIALSVPHMNELWVIDHSTTSEQAASFSGGRWGRGGDLLYRWGNPRNYGRGTDADRKLFYQHDVQWIAGTVPGELRLTLYNNGGGRPGGDYSSVEELVLPFDPERGFLREADQAFGPKEPAWVYSDGERFFSAFISGAQRLPNGNTLVCQGAAGRLFEVTREGRIVWEYWNPHGGDAPPTEQAGQAPRTALFRATRIAADHPALAGKR